MEEASKVRLVRCPKCGNLLRELPNFSLYQCGGCGAVLRGTAKNKGIKEEELTEASGNEKGGAIYEEATTMSSGNVSEAERENGRIKQGGTSERNQSERVVTYGSSMLRTEKDVLVDRDWSRGGERIGPVRDQGRRVVFRDEEDFNINLKGPMDDSVQGNDPNLDMGINRAKHVNSNAANVLEERAHPVRRLRSRSIEDWSMEATGSIASRGSNGDVPRPGSYSKFPYPDEGPSNYQRGLYDIYGGQMRYQEGMAGIARVVNLENDRAELLRKLDELKDQLSKSGEVMEKPKERVSVGRMPPTPPDPYARLDAYKQEVFPYGVSKQNLPPDKHIHRPPSFAHSYGYVPSLDPYDLALHDSYPPSDFIHGPPAYKDTYNPQMSSGHPHGPPHQYSRQTYQEHFPECCIDYNQDPFMSHPPGTSYHHRACSCSYCFSNNYQVPAQKQRHGFSNPSSRYGPPIGVHHLNTVPIGPKHYGSNGSRHLLHSRDQQRLTRSPYGVDPEIGGFGHYRPREVMFAKEHAHLSHPIAGGAPFISCSHCFELLKVPRKLHLVGKDQRRLRCGACSSTLLLRSGTNGIVITVSEQTKHVSEDISEFPQMANEKQQSYHDWPETDATNPACSDHDDSNNIQLTDTGPNLPYKERSSHSSQLEAAQYPRFSSSSFSGDEQSPDGVFVREDVSDSSVLPGKDGISSPPPDSLLQEHPDKCASNDAMDKCDKGYKIKHTDEETDVPEKIISRQSSIKDVPVVTEMEVSVNDYSNSGISHDSTDVSKGGGSRINKFAGLIKRSFKDLSRSSQGTDDGDPDVFINGHSIPDRVLKKVEKLSGTIQPGDYWYDYRAGFWGVMGHHCLGIIPPKIEEFNFPMLENCSNGNTKVFVNGRELHQKDLDLLVSRGLPTTRHKSYLIKISGKVVDEHTGEQLEGLGKLAPTVERARHGFGMKVPKSLGQQAR